MSDVPLSRAIAAQRERSCNQIITVRVTGVMCWNLVNLAYISSNNSHAARLSLPILALYLVVAVALRMISTRSSTRAHLWLGIPFVDMPMTFGVLWISIPHSPAPHSMAASGLGIFLILGILSQIALNPRLLAGTSAMGATLTAALWVRAGLPSAAPAAGILVGVAWFALAALPSRLMQLIQQVLDEQSRLERLGRYFSPSVTAVIAQADPSERAPDQREITVLFADLRGFTSMSEQMSPPAVAEMLQQVHGEMVDVLFRHGATLDKFLGDGIMAYFSAPVTQPDHAARAVACALEMQTALAALNHTRAERGEPPLKMGIGLHTGPAIVGVIGPYSRREYTALGDTVNVASRVEGLTKEVGAPILVTAAVVRQAEPTFPFLPRGSWTLKGKSQPLALFEPASADSTANG